MASNDLINIDNYFLKSLSEEEKKALEKRLYADELFAEEVAFYAHTKAIEREQILQTRHAEWQQIPQKNEQNVVVWRVVASIAAMLVLVIGVWFFSKPSLTPELMADEYIKQNFDSMLSVKMSGDADSLEIGKQLAIEGKYLEAERIFVTLIEKDSTNFNAKKMAGLVSLKAGNYDKAVIYFHSLGNQTGLYQNAGYFYEALALLKTALPINKNKAKTLLETVVNQSLEGKAEAEKILKEWK